MLNSLQLRNYYLDLSNENFTSGISMVHFSRFSTNTFPTWDFFGATFPLIGATTVKSTQFEVTVSGWSRVKVF